MRVHVFVLLATIFAVTEAAPRSQFYHYPQNEYYPSYYSSGYPNYYGNYYGNIYTQRGPARPSLFNGFSGFHDFQLPPNPFRYIYQQFNKQVAKPIFSLVAPTVGGSAVPLGNSDPEETNVVALQPIAPEETSEVLDGLNGGVAQTQFESVQPGAIEVVAVEVEEPIAEVEEPIAEVEEPIAEIENPVTEIVEVVTEQKADPEPEPVNELEIVETATEQQAEPEPEPVINEIVTEMVEMVTEQQAEPEPEPVLNELLTENIEIVTEQQAEPESAVNELLTELIEMVTEQQAELESEPVADELATEMAPVVDELTTETAPVEDKPEEPEPVKDESEELKPIENEPEVLVDDKPEEIKPIENEPEVLVDDKPVEETIVAVASSTLTEGNPEAASLTIEPNQDVSNVGQVHQEIIVSTAQVQIAQQDNKPEPKPIVESVEPAELTDVTVDDQHKEQLVLLGPPSEIQKIADVAEEHGEDCKVDYVVIEEGSDQIKDATEEQIQRIKAQEAKAAKLKETRFETRQNSRGKISIVFNTPSA